MKKIAILGNGQLAAMMHDVSGRIGLETTDFPLPKINKDGKCSNAEISLWVQKLKDFDVVTYEMENIPVSLLEAVNEIVPVYPAVSALASSQDRMIEKTTFTKLDIQTNAFMSIDSQLDLEKAAQKFGYPFIIKTRRFGYDGKGQYVLKSENDISLAWDTLGEHALIAESFVKFDYEVSQIASRSVSGEIVFYPLVRNEHREGILRETYVLEMSETLSKKGQAAIEKTLNYFDYVGTLAMEFFVVGDALYVNEMAPRVHNSGHWSIDGAVASQFENHLRAVAVQELGETNPTHTYTMMINLIGEDILDDRFSALQGVTVKSYGKSLRENRKMGHINIVSDSEKVFKETVEKVYQEIKAAPCFTK